MKKLITIILPAYNEEASLPEAIRRVAAVIKQLDSRYEFEVIILDNASVDRTGELSRIQCASDSRWRYLCYARNFGAEASMLAGLDHASGHAVINVFSDMQDPPEKIPEMIELWEQGAELVYGIVQERNDYNIIKTFGAVMAYKLIRHLADCEIPENATDFRLLDRRVVAVLREMREPDRYLRGLVHWVGFRQVGLKYDRAARKGGKSSANLIYCIKFALHAILCFSAKPLDFSVFFGATLTAISLGLGFIYTILFFLPVPFLVHAPPGITTIFLLVLFTLGTQSMFLGIIGQYVGRIYNQGKRRPLYIVSTNIGLVSPPATSAIGSHIREG